MLLRELTSLRSLAMASYSSRTAVAGAAVAVAGATAVAMMSVLVLRGVIRERLAIVARAETARRASIR
jgi:hypothetical protein